MATEIERVVNIIQSVGELQSLEPTEDFYAAGIDSMRAMDVMLDLENEFGVSLPDDEFVKARTPEALLRLVQQRQAA